MRYWFQARAVPTLVLACAASTLALLLPFTVLAATPSPGGATIGVAAVIGLGIPVLTGWSVSRGDPGIEQRSVRPIAQLDLALFLGLGLGVATLAAILQLAGLAPVGFVAARATVTYVGLLLAAVPVIGWERASILPVAYVVAALIFGGGSDVDHPAAWAWIASLENDQLSIVASLTALATGTFLYVRLTLRR